jgi:hypothetical protein
MAWVWVRRLVAVAIAYGAGWLTTHTGFTVDLETQAAVSGLVLLGIWIGYARAKRAGWLGALAILATVHLACAGSWTGSEAGSSPSLSQRQSYQVAWFTYAILRSGALAYCGLPGNAETSTCVEVEAAIRVADAAIEATRLLAADGTAVSPTVAYAEGQRVLEGAVPVLERAQAAAP